MVKLLVGILLLAVAVMAAVLLVQNDAGFVLVKYGEYSIETTLAFGIVALVAATLLVNAAYRMLMGIWRLPTSMKRSSNSRRYDKSRKMLNQGLIDLAEGRFDQAEKNLIKLVDFSENPLLHYLAAARAAQHQGRHDERDQYLMAAHEARPEAEIAIGVTQAELQLAHQQTEQALATLLHLRSLAPRHSYVLKLFARVSFELEDWSTLVELLPEMRKKKLTSESKLKIMEDRGYKGMLDLAAAQGKLQLLEQAWSRVPKLIQSEPGIIIHYINLINLNGWKSGSAESLVVKSLDQNWDNRLVEIYGLFNGVNADTQLKQAENWLQDYGQNEVLLLALGRICMRAKLWGKAQGYLEASVGINPAPASYLALAKLLELHLQQPDRASEYYKKGLELSLKPSRFLAAP